MGLSILYLGQATWQELLRDRRLLEPFERALSERGSRSDSRPDAIPFKLELSEETYRQAIERGLGVLDRLDGSGGSGPDRTFEVPVNRLAAGLDRISADFHPLLGDAMWKLGMHSSRVVDCLQEVRLPEFEREARAYRQRGETAYLNGWCEEALSDLLEAENRNYPDFAVLRSIASILLYDLVDLPRALEYFNKTAKYARPCDAGQAAEAHYFAALVCALEHDFAAALAHLGDAVELNPELGEAHYQRACLAGLSNDLDTAVKSLEGAIAADARYFERAGNDPAFDAVRAEVRLLLAQLMQPVAERIAAVKQDAELLRHYVVVNPRREIVSSVFQSVETQLERATSYRSGIQLTERLAEMQQELRGMYDLFYKQYEMDSRDYARSIAISPDGHLLATGFLYEGIRIWEVDTGLPVQILKGHASSVNAIAFSPDGLLLASASRDRSVILWDAKTGGKVRELRGHEGEVTAVDFSPDGQWLVTASSDRTVRIWRVETGREVEMLLGHTRAISAAAYSPDGKWIASGGIDRIIRLWSADTGEQVREFVGHVAGVAALAFSPDGRRLASGGEDHMARVWEVETGLELSTLAGHVNDVTSIAFSPDGELVAGGSLGRTVRLWRWDTGRVVKTLWFREISWHPVVFSSRGQWLALASRDVQLWLKALLTEEQYEEVKAGEARAQQARREMEEFALELAEMKRCEREEATREMLRLQRRAAGECEVCGARIDLVRRLTRRPRCKAHRMLRGLGPLPY